MKLAMNVRAVLATDISFFQDGVELYIPKGSYIQVDIEKNIGLVDDEHHIDIYPEEYKILYPH